MKDNPTLLAQTTRQPTNIFVQGHWTVQICAMNISSTSTQFIYSAAYSSVTQDSSFNSYRNMLYNRVKL